MKVRNGFVSNSSSSSFIIWKLPLHQNVINDMAEDVGAVIKKLINATDFPVCDTDWEKPPLYGWTFENMEQIAGRTGRPIEGLEDMLTTMWEREPLSSTMFL